MSISFSLSSVSIASNAQAQGRERRSLARQKGDAHGERAALHPEALERCVLSAAGGHFQLKIKVNQRDLSGILFHMC